MIQINPLRIWASSEDALQTTAASPHFPCETCEVRDKAICGALSLEELKHLNGITTQVKVPTGRMIFCEGDESTYLFNVVRGAIRLSKLLPDGRRQVTGFLFPGDFLGLSVAEHYAYSADTLNDVALCRFERSKLVQLLDEFPKLERRLLDLASHELAEAHGHLLLLGRKTATERLASLLLKLLERIGEDQNGEMTIDLPMSRHDLADYAGLSMETVSRTFTRLRKEGVIETPDTRFVVVSDTDALQDRAGDY